MAKTTTLPAKRKATDASYSGNMSLSVSLSPEQGLNRYLSEIRKFPMLEKQEEFTLARQWIEKGDTQAAEKMVTSHLRLVAKIAMGYRGYGLPIGEVISEGNVGLMQAVNAMQILNEREQDIIRKRRLSDSPMTLEDLAGIYGVSRERIRQIESRAFEKLQEAMLAAANPALIEG